MEFAEKKAAYNKLMGETHLEDDVKLLTKKNPESQFLKAPVVDKKQAQSDILWDLLDHVTMEEVLKNRKPVKKVETLEEKAARLAKEAEVAEKIKEDAEKELLKTDLENAPQTILAKFLTALGLTSKNKKAKTLRPILKEHAGILKQNENGKRESADNDTRGKANNPADQTGKLPNADNTEKVGKGIGEEMEEVTGDVVESGDNQAPATDNKEQVTDESEKKSDG